MFLYIINGYKIHTSDAHRFSVVKSVKKRTLKIPSHSCEYNIKRDFQEIELKGVDTICVAEE